MPTETPATLLPPAQSNPVRPARRIKTLHHIIYLEPRISAPKLAEYSVADVCRRETIAKNAKKAPIAVAVIPSRVRSAFPHAFTKDGLCANILRDLAVIPVNNDDNEWHQKEKARSSAALEKLAEIAPQIDCGNATLVHRPEGGWGNLLIGGARVSVQPEIVFVTTHRKVRKVGAIILNTGEGEGLSLDRTDGKLTVGDHLTALLFRFLSERLSAFGPPLHTKCFAIDIHRGAIHTAPSSYKTAINRLEASCRALSAIWPSLPGAEGVEAGMVDEVEF